MYPILKGLAALTLTGASILGVGKVTTEVVETVTATPITIPSTTAPKPTVAPKPTTTTKPPAPTTTMPNLSGVDWAGLKAMAEEEQRITRQMEVDEARMLYGKCGEWKPLALAVGWPESEWGTLSKVLYRESRCNIDSWNKTDPSSGSRGLMQINGYWCRPNKWSTAGWLQDHGILNTCEDLFNPEINLRAGLAIWMYGENKHGCGWRGPWATPCDTYLVAEPHPGL